MEILYIGKKTEEISNLFTKIEIDNKVISYDNSKEIKSLENVDLIFSYIENRDMGLNVVNSILAKRQVEFPYIIFLTTIDQKEDLLDLLGPIPGDVARLPSTEEIIYSFFEIGMRSILLQDKLRTNKGYSKAISSHDLENSVFSRQSLYQRTLGELDRAQRGEFELTIAMVELINCDAIFEKYGKKIQDEALSYVAHHLRSNIRLYDLAGRWIGAKFLIVLPGVPAAHNDGIIQRIYKALIKNPIELENKEMLEIDIAIGYTCMEKDNILPLYELLEKSNQGLLSSQNNEDLKISFNL